jgi:hypothetical protein
MSAANPNPIEKSMVSMLVVANAGGGSPLPCCVFQLAMVVNGVAHKMDAAWTENTALRKAYRTSREETAALKAAVDSLTQKLDEQLAIPAPPSPDLLASPTTMEEMTMQLSVI